MDTETIVIGASAAGLATAACLKRRGASFEILESSSRVGAAWRGHYKRLHLHTARAWSGLPYFAMPDDYPRYPSREQVVAYLERYAAELGLSPRFDTRVAAVRKRGDAWETTTESGETRRSRNVVFATGNTRKPSAPTWPGQSDYRGTILHSSAYVDGAPFRDESVLVVGFGNSGGEIAIDLVEHGARPTLAVRSAVNVIPKEVLGVPILAIGIATAWMPPRLADLSSAPILALTVGDVRALGLEKLPYGPMEQITRTGRIPLIDIGTIDLVRKGKIAVARGVKRFAETGVVFDDGREGAFDAVVLATGYTPSLGDFLPEGADWLDEHGAPRRRGVELAPGLFACGFYVAPTGMLREIGIEAHAIADRIATARRS